jgi:hypothetical protein
MLSYAVMAEHTPVTVQRWFTALKIDNLGRDDNFAETLK